jgi:hypothetical protein
VTKRAIVLLKTDLPAENNPHMFLSAKFFHITPSLRESHFQSYQ